MGLSVWKLSRSFFMENFHKITWSFLTYNVADVWLEIFFISIFQTGNSIFTYDLTHLAFQSETEPLWEVDKGIAGFTWWITPT